MTVTVETLEKLERRITLTLPADNGTWSVTLVTSAKDKARRRSYYARHNAQDPSPDKLSARYWSHKVKW